MESVRTAEVDAVTGAVSLVADSFAALRELPDGAFDTTITDPPFTSHVHANLCSGSLVGSKAVPKYEFPFAPVDNYAWLAELVRVTRRWVIVFCAVEDFGRIEQVIGRPTYVRGAIWYKPNAMGQLTADRPATAYEGVALLHSPTVKKRWNGKGSYGLWTCNGTRGKKGRHPNEKPVDLALKLVSLFSDRGETVFDPFCGSGAIGEAAVRLGRGYVGWDNAPMWVQRAGERLAADRSPVDDAAALGLCQMSGGRARPRRQAGVVRLVTCRHCLPKAVASLGMQK